MEIDSNNFKSRECVHLLGREYKREMDVQTEALKSIRDKVRMHQKFPHRIQKISNVYSTYIDLVKCTVEHLRLPGFVLLQENGAS